jgi:hypothetical protein
MADSITFPPEYSLDCFSDRGCISFPADVDGRRLTCLVGIETLYARFGLRDPRDKEEMEAAFLAHQEKIRDMARALIKRGMVQDGEVRVRL